MRRTIRTIVTVSAVLALATAAAPATAGPGVPVDANVTLVAGPGSSFTGYATPVAAVPVGGSASLLVADIDVHDLISVAYGSDDEPWCSGAPDGKCPLFRTSPTGVYSFGEREIVGLDNLEEGQAYEFYCSIHQQTMQGTLVALPAA